MRISRNNIFETNSSSTHALAIVNDIGDKFYFFEEVLDKNGVCHFSRLGADLGEMLMTPYEKVRYIIGVVAASARSKAVRDCDFETIPVRWLIRNKTMKEFLDKIKKILKKGGFNVKRFDFTSVRNSHEDDMYGDFNYCGDKKFETDRTIIWNNINHEVVELADFTGPYNLFDGFSLEDVILRKDIGIYYWFNG